MKKFFTSSLIVLSFISMSSVALIAHASLGQPDPVGDSNFAPTPVPSNNYAPSATSASGLSACQSLTTSGFSGVVQCALGILNSLIPIIMALTIVWIIWGAFGLTKSEGEDRKKWRDVILYGIIGLFVMVSIYGLVNILTGTFTGLSGGGLPTVQVNFK